MRPIVFNKVIILKEVIKGIEDVYIEDDITYLLKDNDLCCNGKIKLSFVVDNGIEKKSIDEFVNVECEMSLSKIDCQKDLRLHFKDYQVSIDERILRFSIRYELLGNGEKIVAFHEIEGQEVEEKVLSALNRDFKNKDDNKAINMLKELMESDGVDIIGAEDLLPVLSSEAEDIDLKEIDIVPVEEVKEPVIVIPTEEKLEIEEETKEEKVEDKVNKEIKEDKTEEIKEEKIEKKEENLGFKEKYVVAFFFYKINSDEESYEDVARKFNVDPSLIRSINKDEKLYKGKLIKLAK